MITLKRTFAATHLTAGLDGYPAVDEFGKPGEQVKANFSGVVHRFSGKDPKLGGKPGSAYGWSMYVREANGNDHYLTHFGSRKVKVGDKVVANQTVLGTICNAVVSGKPASTSHIHHGLHKSPALKPQPARLYHVFAGTGKNRKQVASRKTAAQISKALESLEKRFGPLTVKRA